MFIRILILVFLMLDFAEASLKSFADGVVSVKQSGGVISTNDRTILFGGGYTLKVPNIKLTPFAIQAPSLKAGCGGIDMVFGSLGFLDKEQFVKFAEGILAAAPGVAFDLALKTLCPSCADTLKSLQAMANQINTMSLDSCQTATALGNMALDAVAGNNAKDSLSNNKTNSFFKGMNEKYEETATKTLQDFNNTLANIANPSLRPKIALFLGQTSIQENEKFNSAYLLEYMFKDISYINGLDYKILRSLTGDIKIEQIGQGDNPTTIKELKPLSSRRDYKFTLTSSSHIEAFNTNTEKILKRLIGEADDLPTIYNANDAMERATNDTFPKGTLNNEYKKIVDEIIRKISNREQINDDELKFLGRFNFPVYKIFNALGNNKLTQAVLENSSKELATMLSAQILYELLITASFEIQKRASEFNAYKEKITRIPVNSKDEIKAYLENMSQATKQAAGVCSKIYSDAYQNFLKVLNKNDSIKKAYELKQLVMVRANPNIINNLEFIKALAK